MERYLLKNIIILSLLLSFPATSFAETIVNNDFIQVDNIKIDGNTISSESGNLILDPSGNVRFPDLDAQTVPYLDANKDLISSGVTSAELEYLSGVTSAIQTQIDGKVNTISSTDNLIATFDGTEGQIQDSPVGITDLGAIEGASTVEANNGFLAQDESYVRFYESGTNGSNYVGLKAPSSLAGDLTYTLPATDGTGGYFLKTDGSANLDWSNTLTSPVINTGVSGTAILDEDDMASDSSTQLATQQSIKAYVDNSISAAGGVPVGMIASFAATCPTGWLTANGTAVSRATYASLYSFMGDAFGEGDGSTTFHLPDLRGKFLRGFDNSAGNDPDAASRTACNTGGNTGDNIGSCQDGAVGNHTHSFSAKDNGVIGSANIILAAASGSGSDTSFNFPMNSPGNETRPLNVYVVFCIKH